MSLELAFVTLCDNLSKFRPQIWSERMFAMVDRIESGVWKSERLYPDRLPLNESNMFEGNSLCLTLFMKVSISCTRMLYSEDKLAHVSKSSNARFQSQKNLAKTPFIYLF